MIAEDDQRLRFIPLEESTTPPAGLIEHLKDKWWCIHPQKGLIYFTTNKGKFLSPQCNSNEAVAKTLRKKMYPWAEIRFVSSVFRRINPHDY